MKIVLFDLGNTIEYNDELLPGAFETLAAIQSLKDSEGQAPILALVSDFYKAHSPDELEKFRNQYYDILEKLGIKKFFQPLASRITLSTEVGAVKPDEKIFRAAIDKIKPGLHFHHVIFITENPSHIAAARSLGMIAIHFQGPGQTAGDVKNLTDLIPLIERLISFTSCDKNPAKAVGFFDSQAAKSKKADESIKLLCEQVNELNLQQSILSLSQFKTRYSYSPNINKVSEWVFNQFVSLGYKANSQVNFQPFDLPGTQGQRNVLCHHNQDKENFILLCCHYDSISDKPSISAPGADDDASGVAATIEIARILKNVDLKRGILFAAFGGEEQGLYGSSACAEIAAQENWGIDLVINLDMISYLPASAPSRIIIEYDQGNKNPQNDAASKAYALIMAQTAADYTSLQVSHTNIWNSDYIPFEAKGFSCIGAYNFNDNPFYHQTTDTIDKINIPHLAEVVKMVLSTIVTIGK